MLIAIVISLIVKAQMTTQEQLPIDMLVVDTRGKKRNPLMVLDIFYTILDCYEPVFVSDDLVERRTLAALARTCRAFSDPALDYLWRKLDSLKPLIRCYTSVDDVENMVNS